jgi:hypothetical protein
MNTTEYFTYINAMFLFCIFTCGLLVWAVIRGYILKGRLTKEQDAHLKATNTNALLRSESRKIDEKLAQSEHKLRDAEKEIRSLQYQLDNVQKTADHYIDLSGQLHQQLAASKRVRNAKGVFVRKDGTFTPKVKPLPTIADEVVEDEEDTTHALMCLGIKPKPHTLRHGMTVKNPTEKEAKDIFEAARVAGCLSGNRVGRLDASCPHIWFYSEGNDFDGVSECYISDADDGRVYMTASEFIARIKGQVG